MATLLQQQGYVAADNPRWADVLIVNTCGFLAASQEESLAALADLSRRKRRDQVLIAAGCLVERNSQEIIARVPGVDGLLGTRRWMEVARLVERVRGEGRRTFERMSMLGDAEETAGLADPARVSPTRQRLLEDQRWLQRAVRVLHHPLVQRQATLTSLRRRGSGSASVDDRGGERADRRRPGHDGLRSRPRRTQQPAPSASCHRPRRRGIALAAAHVCLSRPRQRRAHRDDGDNAGDPSLPRYSPPARPSRHPAPHASPQQPGHGLCYHRRAAHRHARHCPAHHLHRGLSGRDRSGVPGIVGLRAGRAVRQGGSVHRSARNPTPLPPVSPTRCPRKCNRSAGNA